MISAAQARRIALSAQGFGRRPDTPPGTAQLLRTVRRLGLLQLDSVNVFCRAHYMPLYARLGPYDRSVLDRLTGHTAGRIDRRMVEYWAHEASLIPLETWPLMRWQMRDLGRAWGSMQRIVDENPGLIADTLTLVRDRGPVRARDTGFARRTPAAGAMWNWHEGKVALEHLFWTGQIGAARRINFERRYDLIEQIVPPGVLAEPELGTADAHRALLRIAAAALGIATVQDLADYWRLPPASVRARVQELVGGGELIETSVRGWDRPAFLWHAARRPRALHHRALLSPFDSLIWFRPRTERLFGFRYRIEIYTPAHKRVHGYYVLPFLLDDALVARVDLKSDRDAAVLRVQGAYAEPGVDVSRVASELAAELELCAGWLGLEGEVSVERRGDLAGALRAAVG